jgi:hypothetical protein
MNEVIVVAGQQNVSVRIDADSARIGDWRGGRTGCRHATVA